MEFCISKRILRLILLKIFYALNGNKQLQFLEGNGTIDEYIHYEMTGAHSPLSPGFFN